MKKRIISSLIALVLILALMPAAAFADIAESDVAKIGETGYASLAEAVAAAVAAADNSATITLLKDSEGAGIFIAESAAKTITIDFGGHTYTVNELVGSTGYENQGFHLEKGNTVTLKNGTIAIAEVIKSSIKILIQNYCDLTTEDMTLDGTGCTAMTHLFSNNDGVIVISGCDITAPDNRVAVDAAIWGTYNGASVTIENSSVDGDLEVARWTKESGSWQKASDLAVTLEGRPVLKVESGSFTDLEDAFLCAQDGATIKLLKDVSLVNTLVLSDGRSISLDLNGHNIERSFMPIKVTHGTLNVTGTGTIAETDDNQYAPIVVKGGPNESNTNYSNVTIGENVTLGGWSGLFIDKYDNNNTQAYGVNIEFNGTIVAPAKPEHTTPGIGFYVNGSIKSTTNYPHITIGERSSITATSAAIYAAGYADWTINGGRFSGEGCIELKAGTMEINGGSFTATEPQSHSPYDNGTSTLGYAVAVVDNAKYADVPTVTINGGEFNGPVALLDDDSDASNNSGRISINGGRFSVKPNLAFVADDKAFGYENGWYVLTNKASGATPIEVADVTVPTVISTNAEAAAQGLVASGEVTDTQLSEAKTDANTELQKISANVAEGSLTGYGQTLANANMAELGDVATEGTFAASVAALPETNVGGTIDENNPITLTVVTYLDVQVAAADVDAKVESDAGKADFKSITLEISPMAQAIATTQTVLDGSDPIITEGTSYQNAIPVGEPQPITNVTTPIDISVSIPDSLAIAGGAGGGAGTGKLYVSHTKANGQRFVYEAAISGSAGSYIASFTNPNGFSTFVLSAETAASIGTVYYDTLEEAVNAVANNGTIVLEKNCTETISVARDIVFTLDLNSKDFDPENIIAGANTTRELEDVSGNKKYTFDYTAPYVPAADPSYVITIEAAENGAISVNKSNATYGEKITINVTPKAMYELESISVKKSNGTELVLSENADGSYSFTMPSSKLTISASFKAIVVENPFTDVAADAYYYDAVLWAIANGITDGTTPTTFSPDMECTRAQIVTFLWKANGEPKADAENPFTDVAADAYYYDAVLWAVANGITDGTTPTTFSPDMKCTRAQIVTFFWNAAAKPVASAENPFSDVAADAYYYDAVLWAAENKITQGTAEGIFSPDMVCTRAQVVGFMHNYLGK